MEQSRAAAAQLHAALTPMNAALPEDVDEPDDLSHDESTIKATKAAALEKVIRDAQKELDELRGKKTVCPVAALGVQFVLPPMCSLLSAV